MATQIKQLYRSTKDRMIAGVCGGIAEYIGWDANLVRILCVLVTIFSAAFPSFLIYLLAWSLIPKDFK